jgi:hypothetical protein
MDTLANTFTNQNLDGLKEILDEWCCCFERLADCTGTAPALSKPEETNVGILAGAAWRRNWIAFQEMSRKKTDLGSYGFCDLWLSPESGETNSIFFCECKGGKVTNHSDVMKILKKAEADSHRLQTESEGHKLAIAFGNLCLTKPIDVEQEISKIISELEAAPVDAFAYCFPKSLRNYEDDGKYFPGVVLVIKADVA